MAGRTKILTYLGKVSDDEFGRMGSKVEELFIKDLTNSNGFVMKRYLQTPGRGNGEESQLVVESGMDVGVEMSEMSKICAEVLTQTNVVAKVAERTPLIDAAGPGQKVYQVTVSPGHDMSIGAMEKLGRGLGFIGEGGEVVLENPLNKLEFYWVVPIGIASTWIKKVPRKYQGSKDKDRKTLMNTFLGTHVDQYVLPMTYETPITFSDYESGKEPF